jgi:hypothetical protein
MFLSIGVDRSPYDFSGLATATSGSPSPVGAYIDTSGVKSGSLVVAVWSQDIATGAEIDIAVIAAWKSPTGQIATDLNNPVATLTLTGTPSGQQMTRVNFGTTLPCPGLLVFIVGKRGANAGDIKAEVSIGLEMLSA